MDNTINYQGITDAQNTQGELNPELIKQILAMQSNADDPQAQQLARRQAMVNQMRQSAMTPAEGQMVGKRFVAPSPLAHLVRVGQGAMAASQQNQVDQGMQGLSDRRIAGKSAYMDALTKALRRGPSAGTEVGATPLNPMAPGQNIEAPGSDVEAGY